MITEIATAITAGLGLLKPVVDEKFSQKYDNEHIERIKRFQEVMDEKDDITRSARISGFIGGLCVAAGTTVMGIPTTSIEVPVEHFAALVGLVSEGIRDREKLAKLTFKVAS